MTTHNSTDAGVIELQNKIRDYFPSSTQLVYDQKTINGLYQLDLITVNERHNQSFLFHSTTGVDRQDAFVKLWDYVKHFKERENTYTIQWKLHDQSELHTSYFRAGNMYDALDKLNYGRDMNTIIVFTVQLNPTT